MRLKCCSNAPGWPGCRRCAPPGSQRSPVGLREKQAYQRYFEALGRPDGSVDFLDKYESEEEAADYLPEETDFEWEHAREDFLWEALLEYGDLRRTDEEFDRPLMSTTYLSWWTFKPRDATFRNGYDGRCCVTMLIIIS
jgi:hypothetical protein